MMKDVFDNAQCYEAPKSEWWSGRESHSKSDPQYWHEFIKLQDVRSTVSTSVAQQIGLIGYACDEGVRRNQGRVGAVNGPAALRKQLGKLAFHHHNKGVIDFGNINCTSSDLENTQEVFAAAIEKLLSNKLFPLAIGGGHDIAYAHFKGIHNYLNVKGYASIGIVNFDAHFDLRPVQHNANSGTPFNQILNEFPKQVGYLPVGIQASSNTKELFEIAKSKKIDHIPIEACYDNAIEEVLVNLNSFIAQHDYLYVTIDLDGFSSTYAPGVSAPSPIGFTPYFVMQCISKLFASKRVVALDIAELNPIYDVDNATARLAARLVDYAILSL